MEWGYEEGNRPRVGRGVRGPGVPGAARASRRARGPRCAPLSHVRVCRAHPLHWWKWLQERGRARRPRSRRGAGLPAPRRLAPAAVWRASLRPPRNTSVRAPRAREERRYVSLSTFGCTVLPRPPYGQKSVLAAPRFVKETNSVQLFLKKAWISSSVSGFGPKGADFLKSFACYIYPGRCRSPHTCDHGGWC